MIMLKVTVKHTYILLVSFFFLIGLTPADEKCQLAVWIKNQFNDSITETLKKINKLQGKNFIWPRNAERPVPRLRAAFVIC